MKIIELRRYNSILQNFAYLTMFSAIFFVTVFRKPKSWANLTKDLLYGVSSPKVTIQKHVICNLALNKASIYLKVK